MVPWIAAIGVRNHQWAYAQGAMMQSFVVTLAPANQRQADHVKRKIIRLSGLVAAMSAAGVLLSGCGGGGGANSASASIPASSGTVNVAVVDGPYMDATSVWVTIKEIDFHQSATANPGDAGWLRYPLNSPVSLDLNQLNNGALSQVFSNLNLPVGSYQQIRFYLAGADDALSNSAVVQGLTYNDQVNYVPAVGPRAGLATVAPLDIAAPAQGIGLVGTFNVTASQPLNLAVEFDVGHDVVRYRHGNLDAFTMKPVLRYYDLSQAGAISGQIDTSACNALSTPCQSFIVKAQYPSSDGTYNQVARWTQVKADGSFSLYPLPTNAVQSYDLMLRGRYAQTMVIKGVPVNQGSTPTAGATALSSNPLVAQPSGEFTVSVSPSASPTGGHVQFYQTLAVGDRPYEIRWRGLNPFTGDFSTLAGNSFPLTTAQPLVGNYVAGSSPSFTPVTPQEGNAAYQPVFSAGWFTRTSAASVANATQSVITPPTMTAAAGVAQLGSISGLIMGGTGGWTNGQVVVTRLGTIVNTTDISASISGGSYSVGNLPSGSPTQPLGGGFLGGAYYYAYVRVWNSTDIQGPNGTPKIRIVPINGFADLRTSATATLNVTLP